MASRGQQRSTARRFARAARTAFRWWGESPARAIGVLAACGAIVSAAVVGTGTELAGSASADTFGTATASPSATVSGVADANSANHYLDTINTVDTDFENHLQSLANAVQSANWAAAKTACQQVGDSGQAFKATLPSPDSRVTPRIRQAADHIGVAAGQCSNFGPNMVQADWDQFMVSVNDARSDLLGAAAILKHPR